MSMTLRGRVTQTALLVYTAALEGWCTGIFGPTLPELLCVFHTDLKTASAIFFVFGMMNAMGSIFGCFLLTKLKVFLMITIAATGASLATAVLPFVGNVHAAVVLAGVSALCIGILFNCRVFSASQLWSQQPCAIHLVIAGFALGPIIAATLAEPFLPGKNSTQNNSVIANPALECDEHASRVHYPFILLGCLGLPLIIISFSVYIQQRHETSPYVVAFSNLTKSRRGYVPFLVSFFLLCMPAGGIFVTYGDLLSTFGVGSELNIDVSYMALLTALFWGTFVTSRFLLSVISGFIKQIWIITVCYLGLFLASLVLLLFGEKTPTFLAFGTGLFGIFCAPFSAISFSWAGQYIELSGFVIALGSVGEYTGAMVGPYIGGVLMDHFGARFFLYVSVGIVSYQLLIFCVFYIIGKFYLEHNVDESTLLLEPFVTSGS